MRFAAITTLVILLASLATVACGRASETEIEDGGEKVEHRSAISGGADHTCGIRRSGMIECWGNDTFGQASPPTGDFVDVSAGSLHTCALSSESTVECWGNNEHGQASPPTGAFVQVSAGDRHTCAIRTSGLVACWGNNDAGQASPPAGEFAQINAFRDSACGVQRSGEVACWGGIGDVEPPGGEFVQVSVNTNSAACALQNSGEVECWGYPYESSDYPSNWPPAEDLVYISGGYGFICGLRTSGAVECWGDNDDGQARPPDGVFVQIGAGEDHVCGIRASGAVECWGGYDGDLYEDLKSSGVSSREFVEVSVVTLPAVTRSGSRGETIEICAIATSGAIECWSGGTSRVLPGEFVQVEQSMAASCGLRKSGIIECWRVDRRSRLRIPTGQFAQFSLGWAICAVGMSGDVECAGSRGYQRIAGDGELPSGPIAQVSISGTSPVCAITESGVLGCRLRGGDSPPQMESIPEGSFIEVAVGKSHACAIRRGGDVVCWGAYVDLRRRELVPIATPSGRFTQISVNDSGVALTCGIREPGVVLCWNHEEAEAAFGGSAEWIDVDLGDGGGLCAVTRTGKIECHLSGRRVKIGQWDTPMGE